MSDDPRDALLAVAREIIAKRGYVGLTMRTASAAAGVTEDVALRYYRNREALFAAAMRLPVDPVSAIPALMAPGIEGMGERLVRFSLDTLRDPAARDDLISLARTGVSAGQAVTGLQDFIETGVVDRVAGMIGVPDARMRSALITSYLMGVATMRYGVRLEPLASASDEEVIRMVAPVIQDLLDPRRPIPGSARARARATAPPTGSGQQPTSGTRARTFDPDPAATRRAAEAARLAAQADMARPATRRAGDQAPPARRRTPVPAPSDGSGPAGHAGDAVAATGPSATRAGAKADTAKTATAIRTPATTEGAPSTPAGESESGVPAKKPPAKKPVAKKPAASRAPAKKAPAKKAPAGNRQPAKKAPAPKAAASAAGPKHAQVAPEPAPSPELPT